MFFTQARKVAMSKEEMAARAEVSAELQRRKSAIRSSSAGAQSKLPTPNGRATPVATYPTGD